MYMPNAFSCIFLARTPKSYIGYAVEEQGSYSITKCSGHPGNLMKPEVIETHAVYILYLTLIMLNISL